MRGRHVKLKTVALKGGGILSWIPLWIVAHALGVPEERPYLVRAIHSVRPDILQKMGDFWVLLDFFGVLLQVLRKIALPVWMGYLVLVEDYVPSTIADYLYCSDALGFIKRDCAMKVSSVLTGFICRRTRVVFLDADNATLSRRWRQRNSRVEPIAYVEAQRVTATLSGRWLHLETFLLDTSAMTAREVQSRILTELAWETTGR
jgi:hypothetical protein